MRKIKLIGMVTLLFLVFVSLGSASEFKAKEPVFITSAGQSADVLMAKILAKKSNVQFTYDKLAKPDDLKDHATLIFVSGGSSKGLGAANIDKDQELERVQSLIEMAKEKKMAIITMHLGGKSRRGTLSDTFNEVTGKNSDCMIVVDTGNKDGFFSDIAKEQEIPIYLIDKIMEAGDIIKNIFGDEKTAEEEEKK